MASVYPGLGSLGGPEERSDAARSQFASGKGRCVKTSHDDVSECIFLDSTQTRDMTPIIPEKVVQGGTPVASPPFDNPNANLRFCIALSINGSSRSIGSSCQRKRPWQRSDVTRGGLPYAAAFACTDYKRAGQDIRPSGLGTARDEDAESKSLARTALPHTLLACAAPKLGQVPV
ncbi:hypothetical protein B0J13DRAFT_613298 [Dactylonectria estremocensis]|uniref:Uncharacterized protein n=1 Tax=Dactylonectria estremocensis TaxID=1079267 RepID=A0A9P9DDK6_9HYPO|nr:hypothetical protein B0J13DRAFT_613298 [Dactylonectria estremocensis]